MAERKQASSPISTRRPGDVLHASFPQRRLWFLDQLEGGSTPTYNVPAAYDIEGPVDVALLETSLTEVVSRHEALRTTFAAVKGQPIQVIEPAGPVRVTVVDLSEAHDAADRAQTLLEEEARRPFDLARGPLLRTTLYRLEPERHRLMLLTHHVISDGWSLRILESELSEIYTALAEGRRPSLPELPVQYADYALWQQKQQEDSEWRRQLDYWTAQLKGLRPLNLPLDRPRPARQSFDGRLHHFTLDKPLLRALKVVSAQSGSTLFMLMLAAFKVLLFRYTGEKDLAVGVPMAGRPLLEVEHLFGFFINTVVLRTDVSGDPTFVDLVARVRETALDAFDHQEVPFERLVEELQPARDLSRAPLIQVAFQVVSGPEGGLQLAGALGRPVEIDPATSKFDLSLRAREIQDGLRCTVEYNTDLFDKQRIQRLGNHYRRLIEAAVETPETPISRLPILTAEEMARLTAVPPSTRYAEPQPLLHERFQSHAEASPDAEALRWAGQSIGYGRLDAEANGIAAALLARGLKPGGRVAVLLEDGPRHPAALQGVLKAGGAFVVLNWRDPPRRLASILQDVRPALAIVDSSCRERHPQLVDALSPRQVLAVEETVPDRTAPTTPQLAADAPCYLVYTSGSTGRPKGIQQSHRSFSQFIDWQSRQFNIRSGIRVALWASTTYDAAYRLLFGTLGFGATLCMAPATVLYDPKSLIDWLRQERISVLNLVPSFCRQLLDFLKSLPGGAALPDLEALLLTGEVFSAPMARACRELLPGVEVFNLYGPSEAVLATCQPVGQLEPAARTVPIGRPIEGRQLLILDAGARPVPVGVDGEIHIRSPYLSDGYFGQPAETARRFLSNPLDASDPVPVLRTGDIGRWRDDGAVEFVGRTDSLVKIRGMRVELGEIESHLRSHPGILDCAAALRPEKRDPPADGAEESRLALYYTAREPLPAEDLRTYLADRLPAGLVPGRFLFLPELPYTSSRKLDRRSLPDLPPSASPGTAGAGPAPCTRAELQVAEIWAEVLGIDQFGAADNFFEHGGHSLRAVQVIARVRERMGVELPVLTVFEQPTVAGLAGEIVRRARERQLPGAQELAERPEAG